MTVAWYYKVMDDEIGPLSPPELVQAVTKGLISPDTHVRQETRDWMPAAKVSGLFERVAKSSPSQSSPPPPTPVNESQPGKSEFIQE